MVTQMKVEPDFPVPDDKADFSVEPVKVAGGTMYKDDSLLKTPHKCEKPGWGYEVYQKKDQWEESVKEIPDGTFWQCDECKRLYTAESDTSLSSYGQYGRWWSRVFWYDFALKRRWKGMHKVK